MENAVGTAREFGKHIVQTSPDISFCAGCSGCEIVCSLVHDGQVGPRYNRIFVEKGTQSMITVIHSCQQCLDRPCYNACPNKDNALRINPETGIVYSEPDSCTGCGLCIRACPFEPKRIQINREKKVIKCDLCQTRLEGPACIQYCQVACLKLSGQ